MGKRKVVVYDHDTRELREESFTGEQAKEFVGDHLEFIRINKTVGVYVSENGRYRFGHLPTKITIPPNDRNPHKQEPTLFGNIVFVGLDDECEIVGITKNQMKDIGVEFDLQFLIRGGR